MSRLVRRTVISLLLVACENNKTSPSVLPAGLLLPTVLAIRCLVNAVLLQLKKIELISAQTGLPNRQVAFLQYSHPTFHRATLPCCIISL